MGSRLTVRSGSTGRIALWMLLLGLSVLGAVLALVVLSTPRSSPPEARVGAPSSDPSPASRPGPELSEVAPATADARLLVAPEESIARAPEGEASLEGRVRDAVTGEPLAGATVEIHQAPPDGGIAPSRTTSTDRDGGFAFPAVRYDGVRLVARAPGYRPASEAVPGLGTGVVLELEPHAGVLQGRVIAAEGWPLAGASVRARGGEPSVERAATTDGEGAYRLERLPDGGAAGLVVNASAPGCETAAHRLAPGEPGSTRTLDIRLHPGRALGTIEVVDEDGGAIAGARVRFGDPDDRDGGWVEIGITDGTGEARLAGLPLRACALSVRAEGYLDALHPLASEEGNPGPAERLHVVLQPCGRLVGQLTDSKGGPIQGRLFFRRAAWPAARWKHLEGSWVTRIAWSDPMGRFRVEHLVPETPYRLVVDGPGHAPTPAAREVTVSPGGELDLGTIRLQRGRSLAGRVLVEPEIAPSSVRLGAVGVLPSGDPMTWRDVAVAADGSFELQAMPLGEFALRALLGDLERDVTISPGQETVEVDLRREEPPWALAVRCVDLLGGPVDGVPLVARTPGKEASEPLVPSGAPGHYELQGVVGRLRVVSLGAGDDFLALDPPARLAPSEPSATLRIERTARLTGRVVESDSGLAIPDAEVIWRHDPTEALSAAERPGATEVCTGVDPTGSYRLVLPAMRSGHVTASAAGFSSESLVLSPLGTTDSRWDVGLTRAGRLVAEVRSGSGEPLEGALVRCTGPDEPGGAAGAAELRTDTLGRAVFDLGRNGLYRVRLVWGATVVEREVQGVVGGEVRVAFDSVPLGVDVLVRVRDADGAPVGRCSVILADSNALSSARTDAGGNARFEELPPGDYKLRVSAPGGGGAQGRSVTVPAGPEPFEVVFRLD